jgi:tripartite-type tricarboxylate transporter receptor subunit TctC
MITRRLALAALAAPLAPAAARAQAWPSRSIVFTVPFPAGGSADLLARLVAERMPSRLSPTARMVVENRAGAGGSIGTEYVRRQPADGYSLLLATPSTHGTVPALQPETAPYDPIADFLPIAMLGRAPIALAVPNNSSARDPQALIEQIRAVPGRASWGSSGTGSVGHLAGELMALLTGVQAEHVPYRGGAPLAEALVKGELAYAWEPLGSFAPGAKDGLFRVIAVGTATRHPMFPEVPTMQEAGLAGFQATTWNVMVGPRGLPPGIIARLSAAASAALAEPEVKLRLEAAGIDAVTDSTPAQTAAFLQAELTRFRDIVQRANLRLPR